MRDHIGLMSEDDYRGIESLAVSVVVEGCFRAEDQQTRDLLHRYRGVPEALQIRTEASIRSCTPYLTRGLPGIDSQVIADVLRQYIHETLRTAPAELSDSDNNRTDLAETEDLDAVEDTPREQSQGIKGLLYYIAEQDARRKAYQHRGIACDPRKLHDSLDAAVKKRMSREYGFEEPGIDALYDQFTCVANVPWAADPVKIQAAIDRRAFNRAFTSERWPLRFSPNAMYDRIYAFYDHDENGLIGFEEFVSGMSYLRGPKRFSPLQRALEGFDLDGDGFLDRSDFLRLFRAKYVVHRQLVAEMVESRESENTMAAMDILRSSQPISSIFNQEDIPSGEERQPRGKRQDTAGDMQPLPGTKVILDEHDPWPRDTNGMGTWRRIPQDAPSTERLRHHLSRFEELLSGSEHEDDATPSLPLVGAETELREASARITAEMQAANSRAPDDETRQALETSVHSDSDVLWQIVEDGFNDMLDGMFKAKEDEHSEALKTLEERRKWRPEIEKAKAEKQAFQEELQASALVDPLMATAMDSHPTIKVTKKRNADSAAQQQAEEPPFRGEIVPTDAESLARREQQIVAQPLEELLSSTGYAMIDYDGPSHDELAELRHSSVNPRVEAANSVGQCSHSQCLCASTASTVAHSIEAPFDPMMPQNRPNVVEPDEDARLVSPAATVVDVEDSPDGNEDGQDDIEAAPSRQRLELLAALDVAESEINERGGPGRLSFAEIEALAQADATKEIRCMVTTWLEWASF
ncbi:hypothetical protein B0A50_07337 [Salinomyces thailandicus]|uniref:EF-hand domain-containing protein n=1 Tax=Salinomyces thailandicus TaxID=706561 RepID=A0A4U0TMT2_9PEZI|nr:hypothetical protein B0A50_07337 [Salinomyces thailandica]